VHKELLGVDADVVEQEPRDPLVRVGPGLLCALSRLDLKSDTLLTVEAVDDLVVDVRSSVELLVACLGSGLQVQLLLTTDDAFKAGDERQRILHVVYGATLVHVHLALIRAVLTSEVGCALSTSVPVRDEFHGDELSESLQRLWKDIGDEVLAAWAESLVEQSQMNGLVPAGVLEEVARFSEPAFG